MQAHHHSTRAQASLAVATQLANQLEAQLQQHARATLIVSGGSTPIACFKQLAQAPLAWHRVDVVLSDERQVPTDHKDSNTRMLRERLLVGPASNAALVPLTNASVATLATPYACALLGMGNDGHFASIFPDADNLQAAVDLKQSKFCLPIETQASPYSRITLTLAALSRCRHLLLLAFGDDKNQIVENPQTLPIHYLLQIPQLSYHWAA